MRRPRALAEPGRPGLYHVCSRVVDRRVIFGDRERRVFMRMIKGGAAFAGVDLVSWCLMGNHFHLLVRVPVVNADDLSDEEVLARMESIYTEPRMRHFRGIWERVGSADGRREFLAPFRMRMGNLSDFVKTLKQRFSQWFNRDNNREGTLWEGRFHSVMLSHNESGDGQDLGVLARFVAGYIDLNPVRAGVVSEAVESDWSGFGAACRGDREGLVGLRLLWGANATKRLDRSAILRMHGKMLAKARFIGREGAAEQEAGQANGRKSGVGLKGGRSNSFGKEEPQSEIERTDAEAGLLSRMGQRCDALTKGYSLGRRWVVEQGGS